ncbi:MAG: hypothetical protein KDA96_13845 [Planctomycetaceae bacterium]|nr:hypothetical protein [Planctomycetaceae bacterium]
MYRSLDCEKTIETLELLSRRIAERFPRAGLARVCEELVSIAKETRGRVSWTDRPNLTIRFCVLGVLCIAAYGCWLMFDHVKVGGTRFDVTEFVPMFESATNAIFLMGAAIFFLLTLESRIKRQRILKALYELRSVSHVIDMHQLTKDPSRVVAASSQPTRSSPERTLTPFQLARYLDYCSEMLSLIGKLASLYAQSNPDGVVLQAVNDIETLTNGLSRKIWQKITMLENTPEKSLQSPAEPPPSPANAP